MSQVIQAAVLDLLTTQCDRHTENVFVTREGQLQVGVLPNKYRLYASSQHQTPSYNYVLLVLRRAYQEMLRFLLQVCFSAT
jgi:hypothetical protein